MPFIGGLTVHSGTDLGQRISRAASFHAERARCRQQDNGGEQALKRGPNRCLAL